MCRGRTRPRDHHSKVPPAGPTRKRADRSLIGGTGRSTPGYHALDPIRTVSRRAVGRRVSRRARFHGRALLTPLLIRTSSRICHRRVRARSVPFGSCLNSPRTSTDAPWDCKSFPARAAFTVGRRCSSTITVSHPGHADSRKPVHRADRASGSVRSITESARASEFGPGHSRRRRIRSTASRNPSP